MLTVSGTPSHARETELTSTARGIGSPEDAPTVTAGIDRRLGPGSRLLMLPPIMLVSSPSASATSSSVSASAGRSNIADAAVRASRVGHASSTQPRQPPVTATRPTVTSPAPRATSPGPAPTVLPVNELHTSWVIPTICSSVANSSWVMLPPVRHGPVDRGLVEWHALEGVHVESGLGPAEDQVAVRPQHAPVLHDQQVGVAGCDHDQARLEAHAVPALDDGELGHPVQPLREQPREDRRHVLDDGDRYRQLGGQLAEDRLQRVGTACGRADRQDPV